MPGGDISRYTSQLAYGELQKNQIMRELTKNYHIYLDAEDLQELKRAQLSNFLPPLVGGFVGLALVAATWRKPSLKRLEVHRQRMTRFVLLTAPVLLACQTLPTWRYSQTLALPNARAPHLVAGQSLLARPLARPVRYQLFSAFCKPMGR